MMDTDDSQPELAMRATGQFATTHWSVVLAAGQMASPSAQSALEQLCRTYWYPLYAHIQRRGYGHEDAEDLTQGFLLQLVAHQSFARVEQGRGRFRSFLLTSLNYYLADQRDQARAQKRGAGQSVCSFDAQAADERYQLEPIDESSSPDKLFERRWALTLLEQVLKRLEREFRAAGKATLFQRLRLYLVAGQEEGTYAEAATELGVTPAAVKRAVHRLRHRYYELFRAEIAHTVADPADVEDELRYLCSLMAE